MAYNAPTCSSTGRRRSRPDRVVCGDERRTYAELTPLNALATTSPTAAWWRRPRGIYGLNSISGRVLAGRAEVRAVPVNINIATSRKAPLPLRQRHLKGWCTAGFGHGSCGVHQLPLLKTSSS
jgi:hypothetical protein